MEALLSLPFCLEALRSVPGAERLRAMITPRQLLSTYSVARLATLLSGHVQGLELEAAVESGRRPDLSFIVDGRRHFVECKRMTLDLQKFLPEHIRLAEAVGNRIRSTHQITIDYRSFPSRRELEALIAALIIELRAPRQTHVHVTENLRIFCVPGTQFIDSKYSPALAFIVFRMATGSVVPAHGLAVDGTRIIVKGPDIDMSPQIKDQMRRASGQAPSDSPYVLCIDASGLLGPSDVVMKRLRREFTPAQNRRFGGLLLLDQSHRMGDTRSLEFIRNEHARVRVGRSFEDILESVNRRFPRPQRFKGPGQTMTFKLARPPWQEFLV